MELMPSDPSHGLKRLGVWSLCTAIGIAAGLAADVLWPGGSDWAGWTFKAGDAGAALLLSPIVVTVGGGFVVPLALKRVLLVGGLAFWPGYVALTVFWWRYQRRWMALAVTVWCTQGFFQVVHRLSVIMGV